MKRVFLTGSTGLLGGHILNSGLKNGFSFVCPVRKVSKRSFLSQVEEQYHNQLKVLTMDIMNESLPLENIDYVINSAALASPFEKDQESMEEVNVEFVKKLYSTSLNYDIKKFVQISSIATLCNGNENHLIEESNPGECRETFYAQSKKRAEEWLEQESVKNNNFSTLIMHPCYMLGEFDSRPSSGAIFFALKMKKIKKYKSTLKNFVASSDVANGILDSLGADVNGHYILGGENIELKTFFDKACSELQIENELIQVSSLMELNDLEKEFCSSAGVSSKKAINDFSYQITYTLEKMIRESLDYFVSKKLLRLR